MVSWQLNYTTPARRDAKKAAAAGLKHRTERLLKAIQEDPYAPPPPLEKLIGQLAGLYSRRINIQHRIVYEIQEATRVILVHRLYSHYE